MRDRSQAHKKEVAALKECFMLLVEAGVVFEGQRDEDKVAEVQETGRELLQLQAKVDTNSKIINEVFNGAGSRRNGETLGQYLARRMEELEGAGRPDAYAAHPLWMRLRQDLWNVHHEGEPLPERAGDGELVVVRKVVLVCPLTTETLEAPQKNPECGHVYSRAAVNEYMQRKKSKREQPVCPVVGCDKLLRNLEEDPETERALAKAAQAKGKKRARPAATLNVQSQE
jgi:hypothetical protein